MIYATKNVSKTGKCSLQTFLALLCKARGDREGKRSKENGSVNSIQIRWRDQATIQTLSLDTAYVLPSKQ